MTEIRITVLISGSGSNLQALIDSTSTKLSNTKIIRVISNRKAAYGLERAQKANIPTAYHNVVSYEKRFPEDRQKAREEYDADLAKLILKDEPQLVVCAGFMHVLSEKCLGPLEERKVGIINLHPGMSSLIPITPICWKRMLIRKSSVTRTVQRRQSHRTRTRRLHGWEDHTDWCHDTLCSSISPIPTGSYVLTFHQVISEVDMGTPIVQVPIPLTHPEDDSVEALTERVHAIEHEAIVEGTRIAVEEIRAASAK